LPQQHWDGWDGDGWDFAAAEQQQPVLDLGSHSIAPLLWVSGDRKEGVFLRPFALLRYERQAKLFGL
jgi:predicted dehydrogenase